MTMATKQGPNGWNSIAARFLDAEHSPAKIRVLLVDDHFLFVEMLTVALELEGRFEVVGHAANGQEAIELAAWLRPDVVLMDIDMPVVDGIEATPRVLAAAPGTQVVVISSSNLPEDRNRAQAAGAVGYLTKDDCSADLIRAIELVVCRVIPLPPRLAAVPSDSRLDAY
jgi:DNA-binding NarL/FixJ family response regulator